VPEFRTSIDIEAPPEVVFAHLVTPERMVTWMGERADLDPLPGGRFAVDVSGVPFRGEYLEIERPHRVVVSWGMAGNDDFPPGASRVEFTLQPTPRGTTLHLVHTGLPPRAASRHRQGWIHYLARLRLAAAGKPPGSDPGFPRPRPRPTPTRRRART
jgi:uncharacterized protein YndB with AHSA1/START domain